MKIRINKKSKCTLFALPKHGNGVVENAKVFFCVFYRLKKRQEIDCVIKSEEYLSKNTNT